MKNKIPRKVVINGPYEAIEDSNLILYKFARNQAMYEIIRQKNGDYEPGNIRFNI